MCEDCESTECEMIGISREQIFSAAKAAVHKEK